MGNDVVKGTVLCLEAALETPGVAVVDIDAGEILSVLALPRDRRERGDLMQLALQALKESGRTPRDVGGVAVSLGPGSFTGVRVALAIARGLAAGSDRPLPVAGLDAPTLVAEGAGVSLPHAVAIPIGRLRVLLVEADETGAKADTARLLTIEALGDDQELPGRAVCMEATAAQRVDWPGTVQVVRAQIPPVEVLARRALRDGGLNWRVEAQDGPLRPAYLLPPDAVLPPQAGETSRGDWLEDGAAGDVWRALAEGGRGRVLVAAPGHSIPAAARPGHGLAVRDDAGAAAAARFGPHDAAGGAWEITALAVSDRTPGEVLARLLREVLRRIRAGGGARVEVTLAEDETDAIAALARVGFVPVASVTRDGASVRSLTLGVVLARDR